jgi:hypothetical protein
MTTYCGASESGKGQTTRRAWKCTFGSRGVEEKTSRLAGGGVMRGLVSGAGFPYDAHALRPLSGPFIRVEACNIWRRTV